MRITLNESEITQYIVQGLQAQGITIEGDVGIEFTQRRNPPGIHAELVVGEDLPAEEVVLETESEAAAEDEDEDDRGPATDSPFGDD